MIFEQADCSARNRWIRVRAGTCIRASGLLVSLLVAVSGHAATLGLVPASTTVSLGTPLEVAISISGLGEGSAPSLGVFDIDLAFIATVLAAESASFGDPAFGDQLDVLGLGSIQSATFGATAVNLFELSLDTPGDLDSLQLGSFILGIVTFDTIAAGESTLSVSVNALGDALGDPLAATSDPVVVQVVPEPVAGLLLGLGFALLAYYTWTRIDSGRRC